MLPVGLLLLRDKEPFLTASTAAFRDFFRRAMGDDVGDERAEESGERSSISAIVACEV